jgi:NADH:ubiquinone oxidoreductase subunit E
MRQIEVCVGSSCFLKGAYPVLDAFVALAQQHGHPEITVVAAFCKEQCRSGVAVDIDGTVYSVPDATTAGEIFTPLLADEAEAGA